MASAVLGVVLMVGTTFVTFGSLVSLAATDHYAKNSCINDGVFQSIYDNTECPGEGGSSGFEDPTFNGTTNEPTSISDHFGCQELLYEGSSIYLCPVEMT